MNHEIMVLSKEDQKVFIAALINPPPPSLKLRNAAKRYKKYVLKSLKQ
ncbi:DUF1778 domain-containing protein [Sphaerospermopsis sp. FACHB-1194]|nr:DUF1778 domain-containing protein [Sphaerospermopsis sp. FACHB-1194]MBD2144752.1 DUF1778 domain-containing protein [Sphaerospermopsis sp. FACHB-1194]